VLTASTAVPPPVPVAVPAPVAVRRPPAPPAAAVVEASKIPPPPPPVTVPPLIEEPPTPPVRVSREELERLRAHYRSLNVLPLTVIMDGVRRVARSDDWTRDGWRDYDLEFALDELVYRVRRATGRHRLKLPVRFGELPAAIAEAPAGAFVVARIKEVDRLRRSLLLADGDLKTPWAEDSLIIATGKVSIYHGARNVVIAGEIDGDYENQARLGFGRFEEQLKAVSDVSPSLLISGTRLKMNYTFHAICAAPEELVSLNSWDLTLLNSPVRLFYQATKCSESVSRRVDFRLSTPPDLEAEGEGGPSTLGQAGSRRRASQR
jgi:hypothetical protein